jgi:predicted adenine nucleotide alpha hydrolase (AANH) superfamily ATPase
MNKKLLLHTCCGPCVIYVIEQLSAEYDATVYYFNPNVHPRQEYLARKNEIAKYLEKKGIKFLEGEYNTKKWFDLTIGLEHEPERGKRCDVCFEFRLSETVKKAKELGYAAWATSLSISPHKDYKKISEIGQRLAKEYGIEFVDHDWKKKDGYKIACDMSHQEGFYRQNYCGCIYSKRDRNKS